MLGIAQLMVVLDATIVNIALPFGAARRWASATTVAVGPAVLSTFASTATTNYLAGKAHSPDVLANAAVHGYTTAFWISAGIFAAGAVISGLLLLPGLPKPELSTQPAFAH